MCEEKAQSVVVAVFTTKGGYTFRIVKRDDGKLWREKQMLDLMGEKYFGCPAEVDTHCDDTWLVELAKQLANLLTDK